MEDKENEMFKLLEKVLLNSDTIDKDKDAGPKKVDDEEIKLQDESNLYSPKDEIKHVGKEEDMKTSNIFKFGDAETFCWDCENFWQIYTFLHCFKSILITKKHIILTIYI